MTLRVIGCIDDIPAAQWNALDLAGNPFVQHEFLQALEQTGCVGRASGWTPQHLVIEDASGEIEAALPLYAKTDSWGEFVFDWSWACAHEQAGLRYYPKLVSMSPFTPATGPRLITRAGPQTSSIRRRLADALAEHARSQHVSSAHVLFVTEADRATLGAAGYLLRKDCQFHWHNRGYDSFDAFVATFRAEKRKKALRERRRIKEAGVVFRTLAGEQMDARLWEIVFGFSAGTFAQRGHEHYLSAEFFRRVAAAMPGAVIVKLAQYQGAPIAAAIFFRGGGTLYGRYWGAAAQFHSLHFETCYYQGIEYCIEHGLERFEPGTQGEHKVPRGFEPSETWSAHWLADPRFQRAIDSYLQQERAAVDEYMRQIREHVPYRREVTGD